MAPKRKGDDDVKIPETVPPDPRFPNCNASSFCYMMYVDYQRCTRLFSKGHAPCDYFKKSYSALCPREWVERWDQQIKDGNFPHPLPKEKK